MSSVRVSTPDGATIELRDGVWDEVARELPDAPRTRLVYAAAHVAMRESYANVGHSPGSPGSSEEIAEHIDWEATTCFRQHLIAHGFGIAEAMDTAQRYEVGWPIARELIERCGRLQPPMGFVAGAGTDQLSAIRSRSDLIDAVVEQCGVIRAAGGWPMILAMPWLTMNGCDEHEFVETYRSIISGADGPLFVHWLGPMFLASLDGYFPGDSFDVIMEADPSKVRGCKLSMLDAGLERRVRARLAQREQIMLTGDDFHFGQLMKGEASSTTSIDGRAAAVGDLSHGLLGVFDGIAEPAGIALRALAAGRTDAYDEIMSRCEAFGRVVFEQPTQHYKAGLALLAWLNGHQSSPMLPNHLESARDREHALRVVEAASHCGAIRNAAMAADRLRAWIAR